MTEIVLYPQCFMLKKKKFEPKICVCCRTGEKDPTTGMCLLIIDGN